MKNVRIRRMAVAAILMAIISIPVVGADKAYAGGLGMDHNVYVRMVEHGDIEDTGNGYGYGANQPRPCDYATTEEYLLATRLWWAWQDQIFIQAMLESGYGVVGD